MAKEIRVAGILCALYFVGAASWAKQFPPVSTDEASYAVHGYNVWNGAGNRYSLYDDVFAPSVAYYRDATPESSQIVFNAWVGAWLKILGKSYWHARLSSVIAGLLALGLFMRLGCRLGRARTSVWILALVALNPLFITASCLVRPEMLLLVGELFSLVLLLELPDGFVWKHAVIGALCGLLMGVHHNAALWLIGLWAYEGNVKKIAQMTAGFVAGAILLLPFFNFYKVYTIQRLFFNAFYRPPLLTFPWHPVHWGIDLLASFWNGLTFYVDAQAPGWQMAMRLACVSAGVGLWSSRGENETRRRFLRAFAAIAVAMACLLSKKEALYALMLFPCLYLPAVLGSARRTWMAVATVGTLLAFGFFVRVSTAYRQRGPSFDAFAAQVRAAIGGSPGHVMAPATLWFAFDSAQFRDLGATTLSHWYTGGERELASWLGGWPVDTLMVQAAWKRTFLGPEGHALSLETALGCPVTFLGTVDSGLAGGPMEMYRLHHPKR